jgi:hypothetical protein
MSAIIAGMWSVALGVRGGDFDVQGFGVVEEGLAINRGEFLQRQVFFARAADGLVVDVGELHDVVDVEAEMAQGAAEEIDRDVGAEIADVAVIIDGRAADVEADRLPAGSSGTTGPTARVIELKSWKAGRGMVGSTCRMKHHG